MKIKNYIATHRHSTTVKLEKIANIKNNDENNAKINNYILLIEMT